MLAALCRSALPATLRNKASLFASLLAGNSAPALCTRRLLHKPAIAGTSDPADTTGPFSDAGALEYPDPLILQSLNAHESTLIMLHGLGDSGMGWADIGPLLQSDLPNTQFIFPTAPVRSITLNGGMRMTGWYDIADLNQLGSDQDVESMWESKRYIEQLVQEQVDLGIPGSSIVVGGFSQGGAMALLMLRSKIKLGGVVGLSSYLPMHEELPLVSDLNRDTPVLMCHGDCDQVVHYKYGEASFDMLKSAGCKVEFQAYKLMGHEACSEELQAMRDFLQACFAVAAKNAKNAKKK